MNKLIAIILLCSTYVSAQTLCDSLSYNIGTSSVLTVIGTNSSSDSINFMWGVCDKSMCYSSSGDTAYFLLVNPLDTVKVCYDISPQWTCSECYYVIFNGFTWQLVNTITHVNELQSLPINSKIYDLLGRELKYIPKNSIYIKNGMLYR
tara:strand:+ start:634 stop:1080 length:447 start_codon:yes stop_codon:yes gene_type:complete